MLNRTILQNPVPAHSLAIFRIGFGIFMLLELCHFYHVGFITHYVENVTYNFKYDVLSLPTPSIPVLKGLFFLTATSAILLIIGKWVRFAGALFTLSFAAIFLVEKSIYNNHLYLFILLGVLFTLTESQQAYSINPNQKKTVPYWNLLAFQLMFVIVYFYGGLAKLNGDWIFLGEPARTLLASKGISSIFATAIIIYGGIFFDLLIGPLLLWKKTRIPAFILAILFNLSNSWIFDDINIFPFAMLFSLTLFWDPKDLAQRIDKNFQFPTAKERSPWNNVSFNLVLVFFLIQFLFPFRHYFIPGNADWTGDAQRFSWRMKIFTKEIKECEFAVFDLEHKTIYPVKLNSYLNSDQIRQMALDPSMLLQFANFLAKDSRKKLKIQNLEVKAKVKVGMNGRTPIYIVSPDLNLLSISDGLYTNHKWLNPLN